MKSLTHTVEFTPDTKKRIAEKNLEIRNQLIKGGKQILIHQKEDGSFVEVEFKNGQLQEVNDSILKNQNTP